MSFLRCIRISLLSCLLAGFALFTTAGAQEPAAPAVPAALRPLAERNRAYAEEQARITALSAALGAQVEDFENRAAAVRADFADTQQRVDRGGLTEAIGSLLHRARARLVLIDRRKLRASIGDRQGELLDAQVHMFDLEEETLALATPESQEWRISTLIDARFRPRTEEERDVFDNALHRLVADRVRGLAALLAAHNQYYAALQAADTAEHDLLRAVEEFQGYIDKRVLWVRNTFPLWRVDFSATGDVWHWFTSMENWRACASALLINLRRSPLLFGGGMLLLVVWIAAQPRLRRRLRAAGEEPQERAHTGLRPLLRALAITPATVLVWPAAFYLLSAMLEGSTHASNFPAALAGGLLKNADMLITIDFLRALCATWGLGATQFGWREENLRRVRANMAWFRPFAIIATILHATFEVSGSNVWNASFGRCAHVATLLGVAVFVILVTPRREPGGEQPGPGGWLGAFRRVDLVCSAFGVALCLTFIYLAAAGYLFTVEQLSVQLRHTALLVLTLVTIASLAACWYRRQVERMKLSAAEAATPAGEPPASPAGRDVASPAGRDAAPAPVVLPNSAAEARLFRVFRAAMGMLALLGLYFIWRGQFPALRMLSDIRFGDEPGVSLSDVLQALAALGATIFAVRNLPSLIQAGVLSRFHLDQGASYTALTLTRYVITALGIILGALALGITWAKVQWLAAAMTVGLAFGLQEIFANFVSGLILLFERPIRVGDVITMDNMDGRVARIQIRATTIVNNDNRELIIPNKDFITKQLINWTLSDDISRLVIPIGVAYGTDTKEACGILLEVARKSPQVLSFPEPRALLCSFGASALEIELRVFVNVRQQTPDVVHDLCTAIHQAFANAGIEIPFPQQDIHIRSAKNIGRFASEV